MNSPMFLLVGMLGTAKKEADQVAARNLCDRENYEALCARLSQSFNLRSEALKEIDGLSRVERPVLQDLLTLMEIMARFDPPIGIILSFWMILADLSLGAVGESLADSPGHNVVAKAQQFRTYDGAVDVKYNATIASLIGSLRERDPELCKLIERIKTLGTKLKQ